MTGSGLEPHCYSDMIRVKDKFYLFHGYLPAQVIVQPCPRCQTPHSLSPHLHIYAFKAY